MSAWVDVALVIALNQLVLFVRLFYFIFVFERGNRNFPTKRKKKALKEE